MRLKVPYIYNIKNTVHYLMIMAAFSVVAVGLVIGSASAAVAQIPVGSVEQQPAFFSSATDIPLMENLYELTDQSLVFDKADGRIVEATAVTNKADQADIEYYYRQTLPHLGWQRDDRNLYSKAGEILKLSFETGQEYLILNLSVQPR